MSYNLNFSNSLHILGDEKILTVTELSSAIKGSVERNFSLVKIQGEISGLKKHTSGHIYFSLKDKDSVINAICWRGTKISFPLEDGVDIIAKGKVTVYPSRSQYQIIVEEATIAGEGALLKLLNERKKHFASIGYFDNKKPIPKYPKTIGIITSKTGAVLQDMRHRLEDRYPFCNVIIWPVNVQGNTAAEQVSSAIRGFNFMTEKKPDVIIVARGGGSIEDLWPFNEEIVVKSTYESRIPIISAIGHETDTTLIDYAADLRAPTPTAAIELSTPVLSDVKLQISENSIRIKNSLMRIIREYKVRVVGISKCLSSSQLAIMGIHQKFDDKIERFQMAIDNFIQKENLKLNMKKLINLNSFISIKKQKHDSLKSSFEKILKTHFLKYQDKIESLSKRLEQASFKKILEKGFCFVTDKNGKTIETKTDFNQNVESGLKIHFQDGFSEI